MSQTDIRREIAECIIPPIQNGTPPWRSPAHRGVPTNPLTNRKYTGINPLVLDAVADARGYRSKYWASYKQWRKLGLQVQSRPAKYAEGEWGTHVVNWHAYHKFVDKDDIIKMDRFHLLHQHALFNAEQTFGMNIGKWLVTQQATATYNEAEAVVKATGAKILHHRSCQMPRYDRPPKDRILLPSKARFMDEAQYLATKLHELVHWAECRTGWCGPSHQGELVAEIATGYLETELGLPHDTDLTNHDKWKATWVREIEENPKYLFDAAAHAARSVDYIIRFSRRQDREEYGLQPDESVVELPS
jgi:putative DNA primase/helicase